jgi:hypothetical protein
MHAFYKFSAVAAMAISVPAFAQTVAIPPVGSQDGMLNMPKGSETVPDRVRTLDLNAPGGVRVRSDLADKPDQPHPADISKERF